MLGILEWKDKTGGKKPAGERMILHVRFLRVEAERGGAVAGRHRLRRALRRLKRAGVTEVVLPRDFPDRRLAEAAGLKVVSTLSLRRYIGGAWLGAELAAAGKTGSALRVAVAAERLTGEVVRTVTELSLRYRYVLLSAGQGGEELARRLRREYGVALQLDPTAEQARAADGVLLFAPRPEWEGGGVCLRLYEEGPLPALLLPPALEAQLPAGADRGQLLAALQRAGALRPGQLTVAGGQPAEAGRKLPAGAKTVTESLQKAGESHP